jgi:hypothetical protein
MAEKRPAATRLVYSTRPGAVPVAAPVVLTRADAAALLYTWKRLCGGGGTLRTARLPNGDPCFEIEVQGDHADRLLADLHRAGYRAKRVGGGAGAALALRGR